MTHPVLQFEEQRRTAMNTTDLNAFRQFCDPAMIYRHSSGVIDNLSQYIEKLETSQVRYSNVVFKDLNVIVSQNGVENVVVVMGNMLADVTKPTEKIKLDSHFQNTWIQVGDHWKLLAVHSATKGH